MEEKEVIFTHTASSNIDEKVAEDFKYGMLLDPMVADSCALVTRTVKVSGQREGRGTQVWF